MSEFAIELYTYFIVLVTLQTLRRPVPIDCHEYLDQAVSVRNIKSTVKHR